MQGENPAAIHRKYETFSGDHCVLARMVHRLTLTGRSAVTLGSYIGVALTARRMQADVWRRSVGPGFGPLFRSPSGTNRFAEALS